MFSEIRKNILWQFSISIAITAIFCLIFWTQQNPVIYSYSLGLVSKNYVNCGNGEIKYQAVPFEKIEGKKLINWDAAHYLNITKNAYRYTEEFKSGSLAFFPLFPIIWKYSGLNSLSISVINYLLFVTALIFLFSSFLKKQGSNSKKWLLFAFALVIPSSVVFQIPYSEAVFIFTFAVAICGALNRNYLIYFVFAALFGATRSAVTIVLIAFLFTDIYYMIVYKKVNRKNFIHSILRVIPIIVGYSLALIYQFNFSQDFFMYFEAQHLSLKIPSRIADWSEEGFSMSVFTILFLTVPSIVYLVKNILKRFSIKADTDKIKTNSNFIGKEYLFILSLIYSILLTFFVIFTRDGVLCGLQRFVTVSPFFFIILFYVFDNELIWKYRYKKSWFLTLLVLAIIFLSFAPYGKNWNFSDLGFILFVLITGILFIFTNTKIWMKITVFLILFLCVIWKAYLFNMFLSNAWIFT